MAIPNQQRSVRDADYLKNLFRRHVQGALVRSGASVFMWVFAFAAFLEGHINKDQMAGVSASVAFLILINPPTLWLLKRTTQINLYKYLSLIINILEIIGYTSVIYFLGGIEATYPYSHLQSLDSVCRGGGTPKIAIYHSQYLFDCLCSNRGIGVLGFSPRSISCNGLLFSLEKSV